MEKCGTRAHQARVPQKVLDPKLFPKQCSVAKNFKKTWYWAILAQFYIIVNSVRNNFLICSNTNTVKVFNNFLNLDCKSKNSNNTSLRQNKKKEKRETDSKHFIYTSILCVMTGSYFDIYLRD